MTPSEGAAEILLIWIDLALLFVIVFVLLRKCRVDALRHQLFVVRGELFDYALSNGLAFDDSAYVMLRSSINSMLRFAHKVSFARFLVLSAAFRWFSCTDMITDHERQWQEALRNVGDDEHLQKIVELHEQVLMAVSRHTVLGSIFRILQWANVTCFSRLRQRYTESLMHKACMVEFKAKHTDRPPAVA